MAMEVVWVHEPAILAVIFSGSVSAADVRAAARACLSLLENCPLYLLIDLSQAEPLPLDGLGLEIFSRWIYHPHARWFAYAGADARTQRLAQVRHNRNVRFFETRAEALDFLRQAARPALHDQATFET